MKRLPILIALLMLLRLPTAGAQWQQVFGADTTTVPAVAALHDTLFAATQDVWPTYAGAIGVVRSTDHGNTWQSVTSKPVLETVSSLTVIGDTIFASNGAVFKSSDAGNTWAQATNGIPDKLSTVCSIGNVILGAAQYTAIKRSTDNGASWNAATAGLESGYIECLAATSTTVFAGETVFGQGIYISTNFGESWIHSKNIGLTNLHISALAAFDNIIFANTPDGLFRSQDTGNTWSLVQTVDFRSFRSSGNLIFAGGNTGIRFSTDTGQTWTYETGGWGENTTVPALFITDNYLYAGTGGKGVWRKKLSEFSGVKNNLDNASHTIHNYPNPFTANTTITFTLPKSSEVSLSITDALGKGIFLVQSKWYEAGEHSIPWNASNYPSGVYSCHIIADGTNEIQNLVIVK